RPPTWPRAATWAEPGRTRDRPRCARAGAVSPVWPGARDVHAAAERQPVTARSSGAASTNSANVWVATWVSYTLVASSRGLDTPRSIGSVRPERASLTDKRSEPWIGVAA